MGLIRFLLAITVAIGHSQGFSYFPGKTAVEVFFIISGFYMSLILNEKYFEKKNSYKLFITNRFLRLFPTYWIVLLLTIILSLVFYQQTVNSGTAKLSAYVHYSKDLSFSTMAYLVFTNIFIFFQDMVCFLGINPHSGNLYFTSNFYNSDPPVYFFLLIPQAWTVGLELAYYLIAPFIVKRSLLIIVVLILLSFILRLFLISIGLSHDPWNYRFFPTELLFFLCGTVCYKVYSHFKDKIQAIKWSSILLKAIFLTIVLFTILYETILTYIAPGHVQIFYFFLFICALPFIFIYTKSSKLDRFIGELSYPIYISHMLMIDVCGWLHIPKGVLLTSVTIVLTILFSLLINKLVTEKIEKYRQKRVRAVIAN